jgi:hypothetical protein
MTPLTNGDSSPPSLGTNQDRVAVERGVPALVQGKVRSRLTYAEITGGAIVLDIGTIVKALVHRFA